MSKTCRDIQRELALGPVLDASRSAHCAQCEACAAALAEAEALGNSFQAIRTASAHTAQSLDISSPVLRRAREAESKRTPRMVVAFAVAACALLMLWLLPGGSRSAPSLAISIDAPAGATIGLGSSARTVRGTGLALTLPTQIEVGSEQRADVTFASSKIGLAPETRISLSRTREAGPALVLGHGGIAISSQSAPMSVHLGSPQLPILRLRGRAAVEYQPRHKAMQLLKRHKIAAASAVAAIVLYSGYASITRGDSEETITAPAGVYVDESGKTHRFTPGNAPQDLAAVALGAKPASQNTSEDPATEEAFEPSGAYWNEEEQVVQFRIRGEAFDADSGHPIESFSLTASLVNSGDFAQQGEVQHRFEALEEGRFTVTGLGVGTWRIRAAKEGYAPVLQTLAIESLQATPYLVIPLSASGAQVTGRVVDWQERPVAGAKIGLASCLRGDAARRAKEGCNLAQSDARGRFTLDKLPSEEVYALYAKHERYGVATSANMRSSFEEEGAGQHITIRLSGVVRIYGRVSRGPELAPVAGAVVRGAGAEATTSASGDYELVVPLEEQPEAYVVSYPGSPGDLAIHSYPLDRSVRPLEWVDAEDHAAQLRIDFSLEMSEASLVGTIRDHSGAPVAGVELQLMNTNGWKRKRPHQTFPTKAITDASGAYRVQNIPDEAGYMVRYRRNEESPWKSLGYVNIMTAEEVRADFQLGSATIRGRFVASDSGAPMTVAQMSCSRLGAESVDAKGVFVLAHCYPDGRFEISGLVPGTYNLHSKTEWMDSAVTFESIAITVAADEVRTDVEVPVQGEAATLWRFRILSEAGEFLAGAYIRYRVGDSATTANLRAGADGIATQQLSDSLEEFFLEVPGYAPRAIQRREHDPNKVLEVRLTKL